MAERFAVWAVLLLCLGLLVGIASALWGVLFSPRTLGVPVAGKTVDGTRNEGAK